MGGKIADLYRPRGDRLRRLQDVEVVNTIFHVLDPESQVRTATFPEGIYFFWGVYVLKARIPTRYRHPIPNSLKIYDVNTWRRNQPEY